MSELQKLRPISKAELSAKGVSALSDRPNTRNQYGVGGLSPQELKAWFDKLGVFLADKINELQRTISEEGAADHIKIDTEQSDMQTLGDLVRAVYDGRLAAYALYVYVAGYGEGTLAQVLTSLHRYTRENREDIDTLFEKAGFSVKAQIAPGTNTLTLKLLDRRLQELSSAEIDITATTARIADGAVTEEKLAMTVPQATSELRNDMGYVTKDTADLENYYPKGQTMSTAEIVSLVSSIPKFSIKVVTSLPTTGISETAIYLLKSGTGGDMYTEYIYVGGKWEVIGAMKADLSDYALKTEIPTKLSELENDTGFASSFDSAVTSVNGKTGDVTLAAADVGARPSTWMPTYSNVGADKAGTAASAVSAHNSSGTAHSDIRALIEELSTRIGTLLDSDDTTLDQMSEIVAYIKANKSLIDSVTTGKVSVSDIVNNLTTSAAGKPLSAAQGVALKTLIDALDKDKLDADALAGAITEALEQAKENGDFKGEDGTDGERGTGVLKVSTAPASYTTAIGGKNPIKRMSIATIKNEAGVGKVLVGDIISHSYYLYHVYYLDATYAYIDTSTSIRGAQGTAGTAGKDGADGKTPVKGTDYFTAAEISNIVTQAKAAVQAEMTYESWTFELEDGTTVTKTVMIGEERAPV